MAVSKSDMIRRTLQKLTVLEGGDSVSAEDNTIVDGVLVAVYEKLRENGVCYWDDDATPKFLKEDVARYIACHCAEDFLADGAGQFIAIHRDDALREIRRLTSADERVDLPTKADYF